MIKNSTKNTIISKDFEQLTDLKSKSKGLIGSNSPKTVIFSTRFGIHTFGMKYPIDVIIVDKKLKVIAIRKDFKPNHVFLWNPKGIRVIELESGLIEKSKTEINDLLEINL